MIKSGRILIYIILIIISVSAIYSVGLRYQTTTSESNSLLLPKNNYFYLNYNLKVNDTLTINFHTQSHEDLSLIVYQNQIPVFSIINASLTNQSVLIRWPGQYSIELHNIGNDIIVFFSLFLKRSGITMDISHNVTVPEGRSYMINELIAIFWLFVLLTICPLIVFLLEGKFSEDPVRTELYNDIQTHVFWKTPLAERLFPLLFLIPVVFAIVVMVLAMNSQYVGITGILLLFSICNFLGSIRYLIMTDNKNLRKTMYLYNASIIGLIAFLYFFFIQIQLFEQLFKPVLDVIGVTGLRSNYNGSIGILFLFLIYIPILLILFLIGLYQFLFSQKYYFDFKRAKIIKRIKIFLIPFTITQEIPFDDISSGEIKYLPFRSRAKIVAYLFNAKWNSSFQLINDKEKNVYHVLYQLLSFHEIPIHNRISNNFESSDTLFLTQKMIVSKYPEFQAGKL